MRLPKLRKTKTKQPNQKKKNPHVLSIHRLHPDTYEFMYEYVCVSVCVNTGRASRLAEGWGGWGGWETKIRLLWKLHNANFKNLLKKGLILFSREEANSCLELRAKVRSPLPLRSVFLTLTPSFSTHSHKAGVPFQRLSRHLCHTLGLLSRQTFFCCSSLVTAAESGLSHVWEICFLWSSFT